MTELKKNIHRLPVAEVYSVLESGPTGLTQAEAENRLKKFGPNILQKKKGKPLILKFLSNFTHLMAVLLWIGGIVGFLADMPQLGIAIWLVNIINGVFSFWQEFRAEKATEALQKLLPVYARTIREGKELNLPVEVLVPGDVVMLSEGDLISADGRLVEENDLRIIQSTLTGESQPVYKTKDGFLQEGLARFEFPNIVFAGTTVAAGTGKFVVSDTGMNTEFGKIATLTQTMSEDQSPLQKELGRMTRTVSILAITIGAVFFLASLLIVGSELSVSFIFAMGMIVAFIPEGLLPTVTLSLAMGVQRMAKKNALMKKLSSVETLGCTSVICTDKTGTLTQNEMTVSDIWMAGHEFSVLGTGYRPEGEIREKKSGEMAKDTDLDRLLTAAALCCNARLFPPDDHAPNWTILGDPTEAALIVLAKKAGLDPDALQKKYQRFRELPFDSNRKRMSTINWLENDGYQAFVKGAPKEILELCSAVRIDGSDQPLPLSLREEIMRANDQYAKSGLRVLAVAARALSEDERRMTTFSSENIERDLTFLGLVAMTDPPRKEVAAAIEKCHRAGIRIIMITGDYGLTAESIARRIGIVQQARPRIITGPDLETLSDEELKEALNSEVIFARVAPDQKLRVVSALQEMGHIVAVTGDGVNDAPALKKADIGVAMGLSGTDVAKEAADMVLTDDNFSSIVSAIEEGRTVYNNIRKFVVYVFNSNVAEAVPVVFYLFSRGSIPLPLTIMQILAIDLGTDMVPAIGLGAEPPQDGIMDLPPRSQKESLMNRSILAKAFFWYGALEAVLSMLAFFVFNRLQGWPELPMHSEGVLYREATSVTFAAIVFAQIGAVFACRSDLNSIFKIGFFTNRLVIMGIMTEISILLILFYVPFFNLIFNTAPLGLREWGLVMLPAPVILLLDELRKKILRSRKRRSNAVNNPLEGKV